MDFYYDVGLTMLKRGVRTGGHDIAVGCAELMEEAMEGWAAAFGIRKTLQAVWEGERMVFAENEESEESEEDEWEDSEEEEEEEDSAGEV